MSSAQLFQLFTVVGALVTLKASYDLISFLYFHFLSPAKYHRYLYGDAPYALVTGATDGIGKGIAKELYKKGFNLVIHGRNPEKLKKVREEILSSSDSKRDVRLWIADASAPDVDFASAIKEWEDVEITLVIHNVGGSEMKDVRFDAVPESTLLSDLRLNAIFPWLLTRALLPKLRTSHGPVELIFVGSVSGELPIPGLNPYGAAKAFLRQLSSAIGADEQFRQPTNVTTSYLLVGSVVSNNHRAASGLFVPDAQPFAKSVVAKIGSMRSVVVPYVWHALQLWGVGLLPVSVLKKTVADASEEELLLKVKYA
ncbi:NAD-P-binding protein [Irpex rosettiformis]|uniref:NAD-P-binding protein n=1 Tax=Irpex rosettiformis TaxID=378272 RepID=A0ACB8U1V4_9APHY|nr:NAD-P-binding protein [Irpex rosettiformis]